MKWGSHDIITLIMNKIDVCLKAHNGIGNHPCVLCRRNTVLIGVDFFVEGSWDAVCYNCARENAEPGLLLAWVAYIQKQSEIIGLLSHEETLPDEEDRIRHAIQMANRVIARITEPELVLDSLKTIEVLAKQEKEPHVKQFMTALYDMLHQAIKDMNTKAN